MENRGYLLFIDGHKEYFEEDIQVLSGYQNRPDKDSIVELKLPDSVVMIDNDAFRGCSNLLKVTCNETKSNLRHIGWNAFDSCTTLCKFQVPESLRCVDASAFAETALSQIDFEASDLAFLGENVFCLCKKLEEVFLPSKISVIPKDCFYDCTNLQTVSGGCIEFVGENAFVRCESLAEGPLLTSNARIAENNEPLKALQ